jgi:hypothetical protein
MFAWTHEAQSGPILACLGLRSNEPLTTSPLGMTKNEMSGRADASSMTKARNFRILVFTSASDIEQSESSSRLSSYSVLEGPSYSHTRSTTLQSAKSMSFLKFALVGV